VIDTLGRVSGPRPPGSIREPRWPRGAYSRSPVVEVAPEGGARGHANVESWRGNVHELIDPISVLVELVSRQGNASLIGTITWADGTRDRVTDVSELGARLTQKQPPGFLSIRIDATSESNDFRGRIHLTPVVPGYSVWVQGSDAEDIGEAVGLVYRRMMIGYVDRMGGWRGLAWIASALAPVLLLSLAVSPGDASLLVRLGVGLIAVVSAAATFFASYDRLLVSPGLVVATGPRSVRRLRVPRWLARWSTNRRVRLGLLTAWALLLGVAGNKLSDLLPWP
jgi:hypothetical protein